MIIEVPYLPPTTNHAYSTNRFGKRFLTKEGKAFKARFVSDVVASYLPEISRLDEESPYQIDWTFYFLRENVLNATFGKKNGAKSRYKKMDITNRMKLIEDALVYAIGIDDCQFFNVSQRKRIGDEEKVIITVTELKEIPE